MSTENVITILNEVASAALSAGPAGHPNVQRGWGARLSATLGGMHPFNELKGCKILTFNMVSEIDVSHLAAGLIERVLDGVSPTIAFRDLCDFFSKTEANIAIVFGIAGIRVEKPTSVAVDVDIMLPECMPATRIREDIFDISKQGTRMYRGSITTLRYPTTAVIIKEKMTFLYRQDIDWHTRKSHSDSVESRKERVLAAVTLSGSACAPFIMNMSSWIDHPAYPYSGFLGGNAYGSYTGIAPGTITNIDGCLTANLYDQLTRVKTAESATIFRATERLRRARNHSSQVDRAIDLGIAIEMTMLHGSDNQQELSYRIALNAAWLLGKSNAEREQIFKTFKDAYKARSQAVHNGKLSDENKNTFDTLKAADAYCAEALCKILSKGEFPKWQSLILGK